MLRPGVWGRPGLEGLGGHAMAGQRRSLSQPEAPGVKAGLDSRFSLSLPNTVHPLSWGRPQGECFLHFILRRPCPPLGSS